MQKVKGTTGMEPSKGEATVIHETYHEAKELEQEADFWDDFAILDIDSHPI